MQGEELFALVFVVGMFTGVLIIFMGLRQRSQQLEMRHRERMAMIERGQIPLAEPSGTALYTQRLDAGAARSSRSLSLGVIVVGLGLAMMTIISIAGDSAEVGIGVGGAVAILGAAFIVRSLVVSGSGSTSPPVPPVPPTRPSDAN
ncbi:MAG: hypothetical protein ABI024_08345 [Vicinamibacterales bacterium]